MSRRRAGSGTDCGWGGVPRKGRGANRCAAVFACMRTKLAAVEPADTERACRMASAPEAVRPGPARSADTGGIGLAQERFYSSGLREGEKEPHCRAPIARVELPRPPFSRWREQRPMAGGRKRAARRRLCGCRSFRDAREGGMQSGDCGCREERRCGLPERTAGRQGYCRGGLGFLFRMRDKTEGAALPYRPGTLPFIAGGNGAAGRPGACP